jgi:hypothetical protein
MTSTHRLPISTDTTKGSVICLHKIKIVTIVTGGVLLLAIGGWIVLANTFSHNNSSFNKPIQAGQASNEIKQGEASVDETEE